MIAISGTLCRLYSYLLRSMIQDLNTAAGAALRPFTAVTFRIKQFIREHVDKQATHLHVAP